MQNKKNKQKKIPLGLLIVCFGILIVWLVVSNFVLEKTVFLPVPDNAGTSALETIDNSLVSVFQDGQIVFWNWDILPQQVSNFKAVSDSVIILDVQRLAVVNKTGKKVLTLYDLLDGQKQKEMFVAWQDQDVWPRISLDKKSIALIRRNAPDSKGGILYEFMTLDIEKELIGSPASLSIQQDNEDFVNYALANNRILYAVGSQEDAGRIAAFDVGKGTVLWDAVFQDTKEFCSAMVSPDSSVLYVGNRDGLLYQLNARTGQVTKKIQLLEDGETRPVTNDYSVLNLAFSPDGKYFVATINPRAYILKADSDEIIHVFSPADRLVSKIAFSPDNQFLATSDVPHGYPVKIWQMPEEK